MLSAIEENDKMYLMRKLRNFTYIYISLGVVFLFYIPIFINPSLILDRNNDLDQLFLPVFYYIKQQIQIYHTLPLWNNLFLSGTPLLPDPQFSLFYPPNLLFMLLPTNLAFIFYFLLHSIIGSFGMYLLSRRVFNFSQQISLFTVLMYLLSPKMAGFLEAGHFGLFASFAWLPFVLLSLVNLAKKPNILWAVLLSISMSAIFYTHTVMLILVSVTTLILATTLPFLIKTRLSFFLLLAISAIIAIGLVAITLFPQIEWFPETTRFILLQTRDTYPKWVSIKEFVQIVFLPLSLKINGIWIIDSEKWIALGFIPSLLAVYGAWNLKRKLKILVTLLAVFTFIIALNNASHIYSLLLKMDWFVLMRVSTRIWFIPVILITILSGFALEKMIDKGYKKYLIITIAILAILEEFTLSAIYLQKPVVQNTNMAPVEIYDFFKKDSSLFRIYCVNRCLSQQTATENNLQLIDGYNTLVQKNFYQQSWQLTGAYWNYYTLSIPPAGIYIFDKPQPDPISLGEFNAKYIISPYQLIDPHFVQLEKIGNYFIYKNTLLKPRAYFQLAKEEKTQEVKITKYTPNEIVVNIPPNTLGILSLSEIYSKGWKAYLNGKTEVQVQQRPNALRLIDVNSAAKYVVFKYEPSTFQLGKMITTITIVSIIIFTLSNLYKLKLIKRHDK